jgi:hypothetical protein
MMRLSLCFFLLFLLATSTITDASLLRKGNERQLYDESDPCFNIETAYSAFGIDPSMAAAMSDCANGGNAVKSDYVCIVGWKKRSETDECETIADCGGAECLIVSPGMSLCGDIQTVSDKLIAMGIMESGTISPTAVKIPCEGDIVIP